jgi:hypothetical protein
MQNISRITGKNGVGTFVGVFTPDTVASIKFVSHKWMSFGSEMNSYLVCSTGQN